MSTFILGEFYLHTNGTNTLNIGRSKSTSMSCLRAIKIPFDFAIFLFFFFFYKSKRGGCQPHYHNNDSYNFPLFLIVSDTFVGVVNSAITADISRKKLPVMFLL